jgi:hypothetical protein
MALKGKKVSKCSKTRSNTKIVEWTTKAYAWGTRDLAVEKSTSRGKGPARQTSEGVENPKAKLDETTYVAMDVDETLWTEEPVIDAQKKVSFHRRPSNSFVGGI